MSAKRFISKSLLGAALLFALPSAAQRTSAAGSTRATRVPTGEDAQRLQAALSDYNNGNLSRAKPVLLDLAQRYPRQSQVQGAAGMTLAELGDVAAALPYLQLAHRLTPRDASFTANLAIAELKTGHAADAVPLLRSAAQGKPSDPELRTLLAQALLQTDQPAAAADAFAQADPLFRATGQNNDADLRHDWAVALLRANRAPEAVAVLQASPDAKTAAVEALLGEAEEKSGHFEAAVKHLKRAAELDPSETNLYGYGNELLQHWTFPAAVEILRYATVRYPSSVPLQMALGIAYFGNGNYDKAVPVFSALLTRQPDSAAAADLLGRSCSALAGSQQPGCSSLQQFAQAHTGNAPASLYAAIAILHRPLDEQDAPAAEALLRNALRVDPKLAEAWYQLAVLQQSRNEWPASVASLDHALSNRPGYPEAHYRLARAYSHMGKRDEAQQQIALQQKYAAETKAAENKRLQEVMTFLTSSN